MEHFLNDVGHHTWALTKHERQPKKATALEFYDDKQSIDVSGYLQKAVLSKLWHVD